MPSFTQRAKNAFTLLFRPGKINSVQSYFSMLDGYTPSFTSYDGGVYEMELTRSCIHTFATHCSKLQPAVEGADLLNVRRILDNRVNPFMTTSQFLYKAATIYEATNTLWLLPMLNSKDALIGYYPAAPSQVEIVNVEGEAEPFLRYTFPDGSKGCVELSRCAPVSKYLYRHDLVGEDNTVLQPTMQLLDLQRQGIREGIKNGASFRFMATSKNWSKGTDLKKERDRFVAENFGPDAGGLVLFPNLYENVQQIQSSASVVDPEQMKIIDTRVYDYFGANEDVLQNRAVGDKWSAYYEGKIEPFAIQLSEAMTAMTYTSREIATQNRIHWSANRLQYMSNTEKLTLSSQMFDRGILTLNQIMDIWQLPHIDGDEGNRRYIRKEYIDLTSLNDLVNQPTELPPEEGANSDT